VYHWTGDEEKKKKPDTQEEIRKFTYDIGQMHVAMKNMIE